MIPPAFIYIKIKEYGKIKFWLPIPLFLLWLLLPFLLILLIPFMIVFIFIYPFLNDAKKYVSSILVVWNLICSLRGLKVIVHEEDTDVIVKIF